MNTLQIKRPKANSLVVSKAESRFDVCVTGGDNITAQEVDQIAAFIGDDPDGAALLEKLRKRVG